jgi:alpha/beta superfamily hydrolase
MEKEIHLPSGPLSLEGRFERRSKEKAVVVTHPHPLYGGNMDNPVVTTVTEAFREKDFSTLRFNFRGTGKSTGMFDEGEGEQTDTAAALSFLREQGMTRISLAGYSFGAWINAKGISGNLLYAEDHIMISPPVAFLNFDGISSDLPVSLIITGSRDPIAPPDTIRRYLTQWSPDARFEIIDGCDHFFAGFAEALRSIIGDYLELENR